MNRYQIVEQLSLQYSQELESSFLDAVNHFYDLHKGELLIISPRTKASAISDYVYHNLSEKLDGKPGFWFIEVKRGKFIGYNNGHDEAILIRVKKLSSRRHYPSVNSTRTSLGFNTQQDLGFFSEKALNVYLGYVLDNMSGLVDTIAFKCPNTQGSIEWTIDVAAHKIQSTLPFPQELSGERAKRRITAKTIAAKEVSSQ